MTTPNDLLPGLQERFAKLGYQPGTPLYRVTVDDLLTILVERLAKHPTELSDTELEGILHRVTSYLNSEGMP